MSMRRRWIAGQSPVMTTEIVAAFVRTNSTGTRISLVRLEAYRHAAHSLDERDQVARSGRRMECAATRLPGGLCPTDPHELGDGTEHRVVAHRLVVDRPARRVGALIMAQGPCDQRAGECLQCP